MFGCPGCPTLINRQPSRQPVSRKPVVFVMSDRKDMIVGASIQMRVGGALEDNIKEAARLVDDAAGLGASAVCLPEYFSMPCLVGAANINLEGGAASLHDVLHDVVLDVSGRTREFLEDVSRRCGIVLAGNVIEVCDEDYYNACMVFDCGELAGVQRKVHLVENERRMGLRSGSGFTVFDTGVGRVGVLVCADILYPEACRVLGLMGADIIMNPVVSFQNADKLTAAARRSMYVTRAFDNSCFIIKAGGVGRSIMGSELAGRSLIAAPWGVTGSCESDDMIGVVSSEMDMAVLGRLRKENRSLGHRVVSAYSQLLE